MIETIVNYLLLINTFLGGQLGITLIVIGIAVRLLFTPLLRRQLSHTRAMQQLQPQLDELKKKYKDDKTKLATEQTKLFQEAGINPVAGCLPVVFQVIIFAVLYNAIRHLLDKGIDTNFLWLDLSKPDTFHFNGLPALPGIFVIYSGLAQLILSKMMMPFPAPEIKKADSEKEKEEKLDFAQEFAQAQSSMIYMFPLMFILFGYQLPSGLAIYWTATTTIAILQQYFIAGPGGITEWVNMLTSKSPRPIKK